MIRYMLDTNVCIEMIRGKSESIARRIANLPSQQLLLSVIVLCELETGVAKSANTQKNVEALEELCSCFEILPFDEYSAGIYGNLRAYLERAGSIIGPLDMLIGAHALAVDAVLVTNNEREFDRVPDLQVENWMG